MQTKEDEGNAISQALMGGADKIFDALLQRRIDDGMPRLDALGDVLKAAVKARYGERGQAMRHMDLFLGARGDDVEVSLEKLIAEDHGVRARLVGESLRRANSIHTFREQTTRKMMTLQDPAIDDTITLFQKTYAIEDWCGALGTFPVKWELIACPARKTSPLVVRLVGENIYRWHSNDQRLTRRLHQFADELIEKGRAKPYKMFAPYHTIYVDQIQNKLIRDSFLTQTNPKNSGIGDYFTTDQMELVGEAASQMVRSTGSDLAAKVKRIFWE